MVPSILATLIDASGEAYNAALVLTATADQMQTAAGESLDVACVARVPTTAFRTMPQRGDLMTVVKQPAGSGAPEDRRQYRVQADVRQDPTAGMWTIPLGPVASGAGLLR